MVSIVDMQHMLQTDKRMSFLKIIIHDLDIEFQRLLQSKCNRLICADGKYAGCQGCFSCWTKHPAECMIHDNLKEISRLVGRADELVMEPIVPLLKLFLIEASEFQHHSVHTGERKCIMCSVMGHMMK